MNQSLLRERLAEGLAAGALPAALRLLAETQAALIPAALAYRQAERLAGVFLEIENPVAMSSTALERVMALIESQPGQERPTDLSGDGELDFLPDPVRALAGEALRTGTWKFAGFGMRSLPLMGGDEFSAELLRIEPGHGAPTHDHEGEEFTLVLTGAFRDEFGRYDVGDVAIGWPGRPHRPIGEPGEICYSLAVSAAAPVFGGALGLLQKLTRH